MDILKVLMEKGISEFEIGALVKIIMASICGGVVGLEREMRGRPAGTKTFSLVCIGSALIMITNEYIYKYTTYGTGDIVRMPAQVISGIGFLGAGAIMVTGHRRIKGLTTAAALWVTAAIGLTIGSGFFFGSLTALLVVSIKSFVYRYCDKKIMQRSRKMLICIEGENEEFLIRLKKCLDNNEVAVKFLERTSENKWYVSDVCATVELQLKKRVSHKSVIERIRQIEGFRYIEEIL